MGQGYSLTTLSAGSAGIDVPELADLSYEKSLGDARFMKTIRARHAAGLVVVKVLVKPYSSMKLDKYIAAISRERRGLEDVPNALSFHRAFETANHAYLVRQYTYSSLYDRMSTRPFLEDVEKRWLAFQLLTAIKECHAKDIYHGDIKTENCLVTSWNWLFLSDFSGSFKPVYLPEDNPADFSFYFDISGRRTCYLAPERFFSAGEPPNGKSTVTWAMDIFSVGCVIAELFCEGPIFNLSQLFNYRSGQFDPTKEQIARIEDPDIRELITHMIQLEPECRYSADEYLNFWRGKAFPEYFYSFLHQYVYLVTDPTSGKAAITSDNANLGESDDRISRVFNDFDKISYFLGYDSTDTPQNTSSSSQLGNSTKLFPVFVDLPSRRQVQGTPKRNAGNDGTYLFLNIVTSSVRSTARSAARLQACDLFLVFAEHVSDEAKLDRILPFIVTMSEDSSDVVKVAALRTLAQLLALIKTTSPANAYIFPEYIIPRLSEVLNPKRSKKPDPLVRIAYAQCLATLAEVAARFLDSIQALKREGSLPSANVDADDRHIIHAYQDYYDIARADMVRFFEAQTKALLTDGDPDVRRAFLGSISDLCLFFGSSKTNDAILSHLNTYLNDRDWRLKCAFFDAIVGVAIYVGSSSLEDFILPLMVLALTDPEETVIDRALRSLAKMADLGLFQRSTTWGLVDLVARFTMHPNTSIREAAVSFIAAATKYLSVADLYCLVRPLLAPYLKMMINSFSEYELLDSLKKPFPRAAYSAASLWVDKSENSIFWKSIEKRVASTRTEDRLSAFASKDLSQSTFSRLPKSDDDQQWMARLRDAGMSHDDEMKLFALAECILRINKRTAKERGGPGLVAFDTQVRLDESHLKVVSFDTTRRSWEDAPEIAPSPQVDDQERPLTIADALLDASTTIGEQDIRRIASQNPGAIPRDLLQASRKPRPDALGSSSADHDSVSDRASSRGDETPQRTSLAIRNRNSAMGLMQRETSGKGKATAAISTSSETAFGTVDGTSPSGASSQPASEGTVTPRRPQEIRYRAGAGYKGRDPNVLKLLGSLYLENTAHSLAEFGPSVKPVEQVLEDRRSVTAQDELWKPSGTMVAHFTEHTAAITRIIVAPDHSFFVTGSADGTVKIWDTSRLERNLAHRSRQTYKLPPNTGVASLCFIGKTLSFVVAASDGGIHCIRVDRVTMDQENVRYGKLRLVRQWNIPGAPKAQPVWTECISSPKMSCLLVAANNSKVHAMDLRTGAVLFTLENPVHHGAPTTFCVGPEPHHWLLLGTTYGVLDLWDLRFRVRLRSFAFPAASPIHRISLHPNCIPNEKEAPGKQLVCVAGGTATADITVWDLQELKCIEVYRTAAASQAHGQSSEPRQRIPKASAGSGKRGAVTNLDLGPYTAWNPDTASRAVLLSRFGSSPAPRFEDGGEASSADQISAFDADDLLLQMPTDNGCRALLVGTRHRIHDDEQPGVPFMLTAGPGVAVRFWDLKDDDSFGRSCVVSGGDEEDGTDEDAIAVYELAGRKSGTTVYEQRIQQTEAISDGRDSAKEKRKRERAKGIGKGLGRDMLLQQHLDAVTDLAVIELPYRMTVSGDRSGIVFVWA